MMNQVTSSSPHCAYVVCLEKRARLEVERRLAEVERERARTREQMVWQEERANAAERERDEAVAENDRNLAADLACQEAADQRFDRAETRAKVLAAALEQMSGSAEMLWGVVANVSGGDWTKQSVEWQAAAARCRDDYFAASKAALAAARRE